MNSAIIMASAIFVFALGFKFYSKFLASKVAKLDDGRTTPAIRLNDGKDYMPTNKWVVFFLPLRDNSWFRSAVGTYFSCPVWLASLHPLDLDCNMPCWGSTRFHGHVPFY